MSYGVQFSVKIIDNQRNFEKKCLWLLGCGDVRELISVYAKYFNKYL